MKKAFFIFGILLFLASSTALAQTKSLIIPANAFKAMADNATWYIGESYAYPHSDTTYNHWGAPVYLPDGAGITKITFFFEDDGPLDITLNLVKTNLYTGAKETKFQIVTTGDIDGRRYMSNGSDFLRINNSGYGYVLWIAWGGIGGDYRTWGVKIIYIE